MSRVADLLGKRGLDKAVAAEYGMHPARRGQRDDWLAMPYVQDGGVVRIKYRTLDSPKEFSQSQGPPVSFWNVDAVKKAAERQHPLVITEGELDALAAIQAGWETAVSHPNGAPSRPGEAEDRRYAYLQPLLPAMARIERIILATDDDAPGRHLRDDLALRLGASRCQWVRYPEHCKDLCDIIEKYGVDGVRKTLSHATWMPVTGLHAFNELPPADEPAAWPIPIISPAWVMRAGEFSVLTGIPGHGKTLLLNWISMEMARHHGIRTMLASFEQRPGQLRQNLRGIYMGGPPPWPAAGIRRADAWLTKHLMLLLPPPAEDLSLEWLEERMVAAVLRHGCRLLIIDPWNELDHLRHHRQTLTEYTGQAIKRLRHLAMRFGVHVIVSAHPAKMAPKENGEMPVPRLYDISDSAHWANKPDVGVVVQRNENDVQMVRTLKARYQGANGLAGAERHLKWRPDSCSYVQVGNHGGDP